MPATASLATSATSSKRGLPTGLATGLLRRSFLELNVLALARANHSPLTGSTDQTTFAV
jgi:hypothetical protein